MRYTVRILGRAEQDIRSIYHYIADELKNPLAAEKLINKLRLKINGLSMMPERGKLANGYYSAKVARYRIIYRIDKVKSIVNILRVVYAGRNLAKYLR